MRIGIVAGGSLGHIMPGMILAERLSEKHDVIYITSKKDMRFDIFQNKDFLKKIYFIESNGFKRNVLENLKILIKDIYALNLIKKILKEEKLDMLIGMGGYISGLTLLTANSSVKKIIHEQNKVMGLANKVVLNKVDKILLTFHISLKDKYLKKTKVVSSPCLFKKSLINKEDNNILITSGSNGAKEINDLAVKLINDGSLSKYNVTLVTGKKYYDETKSRVVKNENINIYSFVDNLYEYINKASVIISRAGSSTIFESISSETIPLLLPSSNVTNNHQYYNALEIETMGIGEIIDSDNVIRKLNKVINNKYEYLKNIRKYKKKYRLEDIIKVIEEVWTSNN